MFDSLFLAFDITLGVGNISVAKLISWVWFSSADLRILAKLNRFVI